MHEAMIEAVRRGDAAAVESMLASNPALVREKANGLTGVLLALYSGHPEIAGLFVKQGAVLSLHEACAVGDAAVAARLLAGDPALIDRVSDDGFPALGLAVFFRHPALARLLIERGADVNAVAANTQKVAPVHAAAAVSDHETMELLLDRGADPNARQQLDFTPLMAAAGNGDQRMAKLLIDRGADVSARSSDGKSVVDIARDRGHDDFSKWLHGLSGQGNQPE